MISLFEVGEINSSNTTLNLRGVAQGMFSYLRGVAQGMFPYLRGVAQGMLSFFFVQ